MAAVSQVNKKPVWEFGQYTSWSAKQRLKEAVILMTLLKLVSYWITSPDVFAPFIVHEQTYK